MFKTAKGIKNTGRNGLKQIYVVTEIQDDESILVSPELKFEKGSKFGTNIQVSNPRKLKIEKGSKVTIGLPQRKEAVAGIIALLIPIFCAAAGLVLSAQIASFLKIECTEIFKAIIVSICFTASCIFTIASTRTAPTIVKLEITKIIQ